jgi:TRAP transporter 4TM/12TM fusion protein
MSDAAAPIETSAQPRWLVLVAAAVAVAHLYFNSISSLPDLRASLLHFAMLGFITASAVPIAKSWTARSGQILSTIIGSVTALACVYLIFAEDAFYERGQLFAATDWIFATLVVLCALELTRRSSGWVIPILAVLALTYTAWWGRFVPGILHFPGLTWETVLYRATYGGDGMFGTVARISWSYVFMFVLFGTFLLRSGASDVILALAQAAAGRFIGGPGFVAVMSSGMMGSVSGSAIGNTVSTGVVTIPLMKRAGFPAKAAAGIEAASSTGGQLMPPVMGAGAFLMATYTGESYLTIISVAAVPALLYFLSVAFQVRIVAHKQNIRPSAAEVRSQRGVGWVVLLPVALLIGLLIAGFTPTLSAAAATAATVMAARFGPRPMAVNDVVDALAQATFTAASIGVLLIAVGLVIMAVTTTGLGPTISQMILTWADGSLIMTLVFIALASLVLGLGLPVTAAYVVLAPLAAPALANLMLDQHLISAIAGGALSESTRTVLTVLAPAASAALEGPVSADTAMAAVALIPPEVKGTIIDQTLTPAIVGTALLTAHMIVFWLSQDSNVTPPVCLTAYAAAGLAGTKPLETGFTAWLFAKGLYVIPLVMALSPLIGAEPMTLLTVAAKTAVALYALTAALHGYLEAPLRWPFRALSAGIGLALIWPDTTVAADLVAGGLFFVLFFVTRRRQT